MSDEDTYRNENEFHAKSALGYLSSLYDELNQIVTTAHNPQSALAKLKDVEREINTYLRWASKHEAAGS